MAAWPESAMRPAAHMVSKSVSPSGTPRHEPCQKETTRQAMLATSSAKQNSSTGRVSLAPARSVDDTVSTLDAALAGYVKSPAPCGIRRLPFGKKGALAVRVEVGSKSSDVAMITTAMPQAIGPYSTASVPPGTL